MKSRQSSDLECKLTRALADLDQSSLSTTSLARDLTEARLRLEGAHSLMEGLASEKTHLELSLREAEDQRVQYREKAERLDRLNEEMFREMQEYKMQLVGVQEIKRDRDDRLEKIRLEVEDINRKYDALEREHTSLRVSHE